MQRTAIDAIEADLEALSLSLPEEARYYWQRHKLRFRYFIELLERLGRDRQFSRVLDIGMSYQTVILDRALPNVRIDCLGFERDDRYKTWNLAVFHKVDLNDLSALKTSCVGDLDRYDLVVCMEVLEHLYTPPSVILEYFAAQLAPGGVLVVTTPNAAWLKNRIKLLCGKNPFEMLTSDRERMGHVREYTKEELEQAFASAGLRPILFERRGLYRFNNLKDSIYSWVADHLHGSLRRTLVAVYEK